MEDSLVSPQRDSPSEAHCHLTFQPCVVEGQDPGIRTREEADEAADPFLWGCQIYSLHICSSTFTICAWVCADTYIHLCALTHACTHSEYTHTHICTHTHPRICREHTHGCACTCTSTCVQKPEHTCVVVFACLIPRAWPCIFLAILLVSLW